MKKNYTIALDIGVGSVGYAVLYEDFSLVSKRIKVLGNSDVHHKKKNLIGSTLFSPGETAKDTRLKRGTRRRITRRKYRLKLLQEIFNKDIQNIDPNFFARLAESFYVEDEKKHDKHQFFGTREEEIKFHKQFKTIYHLRKYLADIDEKADLRLIYLACAHIVKYRGNFLHEGYLNSSDSISVDQMFEQFIERYNEVEDSDEKELSLEGFDASIFTNSVRKSEKRDTIFDQLGIDKKSGLIRELISLILGLKANLKKHFELDEEVELKFDDEEFDDKLDHLISIIGDEFTDLFVDAKKVYNSIVLSKIVDLETDSKAKLSSGMIGRYEAHNQDLKKFKNFIRKYMSEKYNEVFSNGSKSEAGIYQAYVSGTLSEQNFYDSLKKILNANDEIKNLAETEYFLNKIELGDFLRKQRTYDNGVIPHQVHCDELDAILENQGKYYPFLIENKDKIRSLVNFRIPYYAGPLVTNEKQSRFAWIKRNSNVKLTPWNFDEIVDKEESAKAFIERMTLFDPYLPNERVLPKHSLIYEKYTVFNELTKVRWEDESGKKHFFDSELKNKIFEELFKRYKTVKLSKLREFIKNERGLEVEKFYGIKEKFNASYETYITLNAIEGMQEYIQKPQHSDLVEKIIYFLTIFEDRKMIELKLKSLGLSEGLVKQLSKKKMKGWGRFSRELLVGLRDRTYQKTIMNYLVDDYPANRNFNQLITDENLSFKETIERAQFSHERVGSLVEIVQSLAGSSAIKKSIYKSLLIVDELIKIIGYPPQNIVLEMARENQNTKKGIKDSRFKNLNKLIEDKYLRNELSNYKNYLDNDRIYYYFLQLGKDMYTEEPLVITDLDKYDIDHIIPQSFVPDDSIDNTVLTSSKVNRGKLNDVPSKEIVSSRYDFWNMLLDKEFISERKFSNLTKAMHGGLKEEDKERFIKRQLVETRQIIKHVANILHNKYCSDESSKIQIITLNSSLASQFRKIFGFYKIREANDYHHAHDAYINGVVAQLLLKKYPHLKRDFVYGQFIKHNYKEDDEKATLNRIIYSNLLNFLKSDEPVQNDQTGEIVWNKADQLKQIIKVLYHSQCNISKQTEVKNSNFFKETIKKKSSGKLIPIKSKHKFFDPQKYGGYYEPVTAFKILVKYVRKNQVIKSFISVPVIDLQKYYANPESYIKDSFKDCDEILNFLEIPLYVVAEFDGGIMRIISGDTEAQKGNSISINEHYTKLLYNCITYIDNKNAASFDYLKRHYHSFIGLFEYIHDFSEKYLDKKDSIPWDKIVQEFGKEIDNLENGMRENNEIEIERIIQKMSGAVKSLFVLISRGASSEIKIFDQIISRSGLRYSFSNKSYLNSTLIFYSVTGLFETRIDVGKW